MSLLSISRQMRQPAFLIGAGLGMAVGWAATSAPYMNWAPIVPPVEEQRMVVRNDGKGSGEFGSPRSGGRRHRGVDLEAPVGTPVRAMRSGVVVEAGTHRGLGRYVKLEHSRRLCSYYGHLQEIDVEAGQRVRQGQRLGTVGKTGNARSSIIKPHLHFEIMRDETPIDPEQFGLALVRTGPPVSDDNADGGE